MIGTRLAHYEITGHLGTGGMGEVYQATDSKLGRSVAIKLLPEAFTHDADRAARFEREARVLASLNHPNIATIHGVEESGGRKFLVMELVTGETLAERIKRGAIPLEESLGIATQITEALEAAHEKGVIHRDLKPANIKVTPEGKVKVLDFGLAKAFESQAAQASLSQSPTMSMAATMQGVILGTAAYMSPEQAKGKEVDRRTDIFAFGAVLYEMLTGRQAFAGEDVSDILGSVLKVDPDWTRLPVETPPAIYKLLRLCLQKDVKKRRQTATDVRIDIEQALAEPEAASANAAAPQKRSSVPWTVAAVAILIAAALAVPAVRYLREVPPVVPSLSTSLNAPEGTAMLFGNAIAATGTPELSPDGKWIVFAARTADNKNPLWLRPLSSTTAQMLAGTDEATFPFWAPDSRYVAFFHGGKLKKIDITGGPAIAIADATSGRGGSWSSEGTILFAPNSTGPLLKIASSGGTATPATSPEATKSNSHRFPWFLPDGQHFLFQEQLATGSNDNVLQIGSLDSQETVEIGRASSNAVYSSGHLLFLREDTLMAQPFDPDKRTVQGEAVPVAERVSFVFGGGRKGVFTVSGTGLLAYQTGGSTGQQKLSWFDRTGKIVGTLGELGDFTNLELSPERKSAAVSSSIDATRNRDIWIYDIARNLGSRFTFDPAPDLQPVWSPDGTALVWVNVAGKGKLLRKFADGKGTEEVLYEDTGVSDPTSWSPDGKFLLFNKTSTGTGQGVWILPLVPEKPGTPLKPTALVDTTFTEARGVFSPDGRWVAYSSNESQQNEIYVIPFPGPGGKRQISTMGGAYPRWRHDGKEIFYVGGDGKLMAAEVTLKASSIDVGKVSPLGITVPTNRVSPYDVSLDGQRILAITEPERSASPPLTLLQNWTALLKK